MCSMTASISQSWVDQIMYKFILRMKVLLAPIRVRSNFLKKRKEIMSFLKGKEEEGPLPAKLQMFLEMCIMKNIRSAVLVIFGGGFLRVHRHIVTL